MKNTKIILSAITVALIVGLNGCSKEDKDAVSKDKQKLGTVNIEAIKTNLTKQGIDVSKVLQSENPQKSASDFLEAGVDWRLARGEVWGRLGWHYNWSFCAAEGYSIYNRFELYTENGSFVKNYGEYNLGTCIDAGEGEGDECYYDGPSTNVVVVVVAWAVNDSNPNDSYFLGYAWSNVVNAPTSGLCDTYPN